MLLHSLIKVCTSPLQLISHELIAGGCGIAVSNDNRWILLLCPIPCNKVTFNHLLFLYCRLLESTMYTEWRTSECVPNSESKQLHSSRDSTQLSTRAGLHASLPMNCRDWYRVTRLFWMLMTWGECLSQCKLVLTESSVHLVVRYS